MRVAAPNKWFPLDMANNSGNNVFNSLSLLSSADVVLTLPPSELNFMGKGIGGGGGVFKNIQLHSSKYACLGLVSLKYLIPQQTNKDVLVQSISQIYPATANLHKLRTLSEPLHHSEEVIITTVKWQHFGCVVLSVLLVLVYCHGEGQDKLLYMKCNSY